MARKYGYPPEMPTPDPSSETTVRHPREGLITLAHVIYALHAFSAFTGLLSWKCGLQRCVIIASNVTVARC